jgi:UDP-4-amino-4,6-dideoxy-N-acetyl-beta-L-altrosamine N-acetyltransferase
MTAEGTRLRPLEPTDIDRVRGWRNLPEIRQWMYTDHEISVEEHARWFGQALSDATRRYWIIELDGEPVGLTNLYDISRVHGTANWAIYLADPGVRGRGAGRAAALAALASSFGELGLHKVSCEVLATNEAAIRLYERIGFRRDGLLRQHIVKGDDRIDVITMSLLRDEFAAMDRR